MTMGVGVWHMTGPRIAVSALLLMTAGAQAGEGPVFAPEDIADWENRAFVRETRYTLVEKDGRSAVQAECRSSASGLFFEEPIDLSATPVMEWSWRIETTYGDIDETTRAGDDYPARVYVISDGGLTRWRTRALNYVWASAKPEGADWRNAYAAQNRMLAVRSGDEDAGRWVTQRRNVVEDFRDLHDRDITRIDAVAIMTDCDDTRSEARAWYGEIRFLPE
ncbi:hypothetical protein B1C78_14065 [Thioalkalivibrio denitrificans]|uniref:DUF3047 domain-containing protein n=2 Tax=Thioalkalivibrio denitrificans TaxID=108003 RepID=A0A1V3NCN1_9GAMM|nr:hypothetical protein B1C78_14065 [Thioalkalivibrio denitrificans]